MAPHPVFLRTLPPRVTTGLFERRDHFAREAVVPNGLHRSLDPPLVPRAPHPRRVDEEPTGLGIRQERRHDPRLQWVRLWHDRFRVVRDRHAEDPAEELPRRLASLGSSGFRCVIQPTSTWTSEPGSQSATGIVGPVEPNPGSAIA